METYIKDIEEKLSYYYNVERDFTLHNNTYDLYACSNVSNAKYMGSKKLVIYAYDNNSHVYLKKCETLKKHDIENILNDDAQFLLEGTSVNDEHMSTHYTIVFVTNDDVSDDVKNFVKRYRKQKSFAFGFKGWSSIGVVVVSLSQKTVINNKDAKKIVGSFRPL